MLKGAFSPQEIIALSHALCAYVQEADLSKDEFLELCSQSAKDLAEGEQ